MRKTQLGKIFLWAARIIGAIMIAITLIFLVGSLFEGKGNSNPDLSIYTIITFVFWGIGILGLMFAYWKPEVGGIISLISFIAFNLLVAVNPNSDSGFPFILLFFVFPSIFYILSWWLKKM